MKRKTMTNNNKSSIAEIRGHLLELIFDMPEAETRQLLNELKVRLQSKSEERREHPRKKTFIQVDCAGARCAITDFIQNLSVSGLFIETQIPFYAGEKLSMTFSLPGAEDPIKITGKIIRVNSRGIGVQFDEFLPDI
jgi:hypothetical protein